jgi:hypothetical protein
LSCTGEHFSDPQIGGDTESRVVFEARAEDDEAVGEIAANEMEVDAGKSLIHPSKQPTRGPRRVRTFGFQKRKSRRAWNIDVVVPLGD